MHTTTSETTDINQEDLDEMKELEERLYGKRIVLDKGLLDYLSEERREIFAKFKQSVHEADWVKDLEEDELDYLRDDRNILRGLEGCGFNVVSSMNSLKKITAWRAEKKPHRYRLKDLGEVGRLGMIQTHGFDKNGHPILYINARQMDVVAEQYELKFKCFLYGMERCLALMPPNVHRITWIFDMRDAPIGYSLVMKMKDMFLQLGDYYPEVINVNIICNVSWTLSFIWKLASTFIEKSVLLRYFVFRQNDSNPTELHQFLHHHVDPSTLLKSLGGPLPNPWNIEDVLRYEELMDQLEEQTKKENALKKEEQVAQDNDLKEASESNLEIA